MIVGPDVARLACGEPVRAPQLAFEAGLGINGGRNGIREPAIAPDGVCVDREGASPTPRH